MRWLKIVLAINGVLNLGYAVGNIVAPTSFFLPGDASGYAIDVTRVVGVGYLALGLIQLGTWMVTDRLAVRLVAGASLVYNAGFAILGATIGTGSSDPFHQIGLVAGIGNGVVAVLYAFLLYRERSEAG